MTSSSATTHSRHSNVLLPAKDDIDFASLPWNLNLPKEHYYFHITTSDDGCNWNEYENALQESMSSSTSTSNEPTVDTFHNLLLKKNCIKSYNDEPLSLYPATTSLNYGTTIWEGLKCYRIHNEHAVVFRPEQNYIRMSNGANEMCIPMISKTLFLRCIQLIIQYNTSLIPPAIGYGMKLYIRPMLLGSGQQLGLYPSSQFSFIIYVSPTGSYFGNSNTSPGLNLHLETRRSRACYGGIGHIKCSGNYAIALKPLIDCKKHGFNDNIYVELNTSTSMTSTNHNDHNNDDTLIVPKTKNSSSLLSSTIIQEMSAANIFFVMKNGHIITPSLHRNTILPGITRLSILQIINYYSIELIDPMNDSIKQMNSNTTTTSVPVVDHVKGYSCDVTISDLENVVEVFCTGTAAEIVPIARIATSPDDDNTDQMYEWIFPHGQTIPGGPITTKLLSIMREIMYGQRPSPSSSSSSSSTTTNDDNDTVTNTNWIRDPFSPMNEFCK